MFRRRGTGGFVGRGNNDTDNKKQQPTEISHDGTATTIAESTFTTTSSTTTPTTNNNRAASLIQSAARSVLDDSSPSSDDEEESNADGHSGTRASKISSSNRQFTTGLESLQKQTVPAMPDVQDRKRFVGCLAAIIASAYDYDVIEDDVDVDMLEESYAYMDDNNKDATTKAKASLSSALSSSFDYPSSQDIEEGATTEEASDSYYTPGKGNNNNNKIKKMKSARSTNKEDIRNQLNRRRRRRYEVMSELLLVSAELLLLDKSQARALLPMLDRLLKRQQTDNNKTSAVQDSSRRNRFPSFRKNSNENIQGAGAKLSQSSPSVLSDGSSSFLGNASEVSEASSTGGGMESASHHSNTGAMTAAAKEEKEKREYLPPDLDQDDTLRPFLESLSPGAGFRCLSLLMIQHLLHSENGYDARIRHVLKKLGVTVLVHDIKLDLKEEGQQEDARLNSPSHYAEMVLRATRVFESLEHSIAEKLIHLSHEEQRRKGRKNSAAKKPEKGEGRRGKRVTREQIVRGIKIGGVGLAAGALFAVTGGLAAPGIAAGVAAIAGSAAGTAAVITLTSTTAVTAIFGVGGGSLAAYKMQRRTQGLTEFEFQKESGNGQNPDEQGQSGAEAQLYSTICISGWLRDEYDFQRPWGVQPSRPPLIDRQELLERFYSVHRPDFIARSASILRRFNGEEKVLWNMLRAKYGRDPDHIFPLESGPRFTYAVTLEQDEIIDQLFVELGYASVEKDAQEQPTPLERLREGLGHQQPGVAKSEEVHGSVEAGTTGEPYHLVNPAKDVAFENSISAAASSSDDESKGEQSEKEPALPKHLATVWDYQANYGGELYTVRWETSILTELCDSVADLAFDMVTGATTQLLKQTALSTLLSAVALPYALVSVANAIDGTWTLGIERSSEAGRELAHSLLFSRAGHRPVTLIGFSFGARVIYACLKELARFQEGWLDYHKKNDTNAKVNESPRKRNSNEGGDDMYKNMREPASIVEDAILMGLPNHLSLKSWVLCRQVVAGRLVNCYSRKDLILSLMFQYKRLAGGFRPVCGTCPVAVPGVENVDVTDIVSGHQDYCLVAGDILKRVRHGQPLRMPTWVVVDADADGNDDKDGVPAPRQLDYDLDVSESREVET